MSENENVGITEEKKESKFKTYMKTLPKRYFITAFRVWLRDFS